MVIDPVGKLVCLTVYKKGTMIGATAGGLETE
jgi:hypothetical protein